LDTKADDVQASKSDAEGSVRSPKRRKESSVGSEKAHESKSVEEPATAGRSKDSAATRSTEKDSDVPTPASQASQNTQPAPITDEHYKRSNDALAAARERALARKRAKELQI
jgi:coiled-coil domain-containing protein 55